MVALPSAAATALASGGSDRVAGGSMSRTLTVIPGSGMQEKSVVMAMVPPCCMTLRSAERVTRADVTILCIRNRNLIARAAERSTSENVARNREGSPKTIAAAPRKAAITQMPRVQRSGSTVYGTSIVSRISRTTSFGWRPSTSASRERTIRWLRISCASDLTSSGRTYALFAIAAFTRVPRTNAIEAREEAPSSISPFSRVAMTMSRI